MKRRIGFWLGLVLFALALVFLDLEPGQPRVTRMTAVALLMATWWVTEALPIPVTSLLPLLLFPILGIMPGQDTASTYMNSSIFLFMGGFIIALSIEKWGLHRRIALGVIGFLGSRPRMIVLGFMIATAFLSMWISNTATAMLMLPIGLSVVSQIESEGGRTDFSERFALVLMLSIAYAANVGGMGTLIGTPPNLAFARIFSITFPEAPEISFSKWLLLGVPLIVVFLAVIWVFLTFAVHPIGGTQAACSRDVIRRERQGLGPMGPEEKRVLGVFGWSDLLGLDGVDDGTVAMFMAILLFALPATERGRRLMDWETATQLPWGILLLFGGGFALAAGFKQSTLDVWIGGHFQPLAGTSTTGQIITVSTLVTFLTEVTSNTATSQMFLPILAAIAEGIRMNPLLLMIPATLSASCAFMLPVGTPPNAIVFGSGRVPMISMVRAGVLLNLIGVVLVYFTVMFLARFIFGISLTELPHWVPWLH
jgi:sodium-dependent dicarboxylate transporter 2/3/5